MQDRAREFPGQTGKSERELDCLGKVLQQRSGESLCQIAPKGSSGLGCFVAIEFDLSVVSRCWEKFCGMCKVGRLQMALKIWEIFWTVLKQFEFGTSGLWSNGPSLL